MRHSMERIAVVVGDAALISGLSLEALNDIGHRQTQLLIVLNDNAMSISPTVGAFSQYFSTLKLSSAWKQSKTAYDRIVESLPVVGQPALSLSRRIRRMVVNFAQPGQLFEDLGITYLGVIPGHNIRGLEHIFRAALEVPGPVLVHVRTRKGRGYRPAERDQVGFHGAALPPMPELGGRSRAGPPRRRRPSADDRTGAGAQGERHAAAGRARRGALRAVGQRQLRSRRRRHGDAVRAARGRRRPRPPNYTYYFSTELIELARTDRRIVAVTAGMPTGTGLHVFQAEFPDRFIDVGIAEQHAVALSAGMALRGERPVVALYSTFLQRAFDQEVHDVCQNDLPVVIAVDRAGLVGEDGTSHQGMFTPAEPAPAAEHDHRQPEGRAGAALAGADRPGPGSSVRTALPARSRLRRARRERPRFCPVGVGEVLREGRQILIVGFGPIVERGRAGGRPARGGRLVGRGHQRPLRQAARSPADPGPGPRQEARW